MLSFDLLKQVPKLNTQIDFTRLPVAIDDTEILVLSRVNGLIGIGELSEAYKLDHLEMERIVAKLVKNNLIFFDDPRVRRELVAEIDETRSYEEHTALVDEMPEVETKKIDREFEAPAKGKEYGTWDLDSVFDLINRCHMDHQTGILRLFFEPGHYKALFFEDGELANVSSVPFEPSECLGRILQRAGRLTQDKVVKSLERSRASGKLQGEELVAMGALRRDLLPEMLRVQIEAKLAEIMQYGEGKWEFQIMPELPPRISRIQLDLPRLLFAMIWKHYPFDRLEEHLKSRKDSYIGRLERTVYPIEDFSFGKSIEKFCSILEKDSQFKRLLIVGHLKPDQTYRVIWALYLTGMIDFYEDTREDKSIVRIQDLRDELKRIDRESLFEVLGVHWTTNDEMVQKAYRKRIAEQQMVIKKTEGLEQHLNKKLIEHIEEAYEALKTIDLRREYREKIFDEDFIVFGSDILRQKGESFLFTKEEMSEAVSELESAIEVYDKDGEYWSTLGLAYFYKFYPRDVRKYEEARQMIRKGLSISPQSEVSNLCLGLMFKRERRNTQAVEQLKKVVKINPRNRFARIEIEEVETGKTSIDRDKAVREFVDRRGKSDKDFDQIMEGKRKRSSKGKKKPGH